MREELTEKDIIRWIFDHCEETEVIDRINQISWPYTSKFRGSGRGGF